MDAVGPAQAAASHELSDLIEVVQVMQALCATPTECRVWFLSWGTSNGISGTTLDRPGRRCSICDDVRYELGPPIDQGEQGDEAEGEAHGKEEFLPCALRGAVVSPRSDAQ
eukprot:gene3539-biopygen13410